VVLPAYQVGREGGRAGGREGGRGEAEWLGMGVADAEQWKVVLPAYQVGW